MRRPDNGSPAQLSSGFYRILPLRIVARVSRYETYKSESFLSFVLSFFILVQSCTHLWRYSKSVLSEQCQDSCGPPFFYGPPTSCDRYLRQNGRIKFNRARSSPLECPAKRRNAAEGTNRLPLSSLSSECSASGAIFTRTLQRKRVLVNTPCVNLFALLEYSFLGGECRIACRIVNLILSSAISARKKYRVHGMLRSIECHFCFNWNIFNFES